MDYIIIEYLKRLNYNNKIFIKKSIDNKQHIQYNRPSNVWKCTAENIYSMIIFVVYLNRA